MLKILGLLVSVSLPGLFPLHLAHGQADVGISAGESSGTRVVYLVRHAEKRTDDPAERDPALTAAGKERAVALARLLRDANIERVYSTDYRRTRQTATPLAQQSGLPVTLYDPRDLEGFAGRLRNGPTRVLVVGHSNTTPQLVALLGGEPGSEIRESHEYDRLYVLVLHGDETVTLLQRYGDCEPCERAY
ncbi:SixA phosphatase family protein [Microbulbifer guangxiensis]|uniref:SixA phosphatase family protein n=1 Tax=Microbulbifer guangxiensis TaxID=2904249 RepID=UPI001F16F15B|nr:phosphoglycerate mutase family protein [Microbulbifer guangxiensis]